MGAFLLIWLLAGSASPAELQASAEAAVRAWAQCVVKGSLDPAMSAKSPEEAVSEAERRCEAEEKLAMTGIDAAQTAHGEPLTAEQLESLRLEIKQSGHRLNVSLLTGWRRQQSEGK